MVEDLENEVWKMISDNSNLIRKRNKVYVSNLGRVKIVYRSGHIRERQMNRSKKHKIDNSDIPTEEDFKREEQERYAKLDKKYKFSSLLAMADHGDISSKDLNILLEAFKFKYLRAKPCKLGFTPSSTSIAFKKFVNYTISRISANS